MNQIIPKEYYYDRSVFEQQFKYHLYNNEKFNAILDLYDEFNYLDRNAFSKFRLFPMRLYGLIFASARKDCLSIVGLYFRKGQNRSKLEKQHLNSINNVTTTMLRMRWYFASKGRNII